MSLRNMAIASVTIGCLPNIRFNVLTVGESGLGKTTFLKTLLRKFVPAGEMNQHFVWKWCNDESGSPSNSHVRLQTTGPFQLMSESANQDLRLSLYNAKGFGDAIDNSSAVQTCHDFIVDKHKAWLQVEGQALSTSVRNSLDDRIHLCFYFISPHRLKELDLLFLAKCAGTLSIVPIVAKADTMTRMERRNFLRFVDARINEVAHTIDKPVIYHLNHVTEPEDDESLVTTPRDQTHLDEKEVDVKHSVSSKESQNLSDIESPHSVATRSLDVQEEQYNLNKDLLAEYDMTFDDVVTFAPPSLSQASHDVDTHDHSVPTNPPVRFMCPNAMPPLGMTPLPLESLLHSHFSVEEEMDGEDLLNVFAVCGSQDSAEMRVYSWGTLDITSAQHCDFVRLQRLLFEEASNISNIISETQECTKRVHSERSGALGWIRSKVQWVVPMLVTGGLFIESYFIFSLVVKALSSRRTFCR